MDKYSEQKRLRIMERDEKISPSITAVLDISTMLPVQAATHSKHRATSPHTPSPLQTLAPAPPLQPLVQTFVTPLHRKKGRLERSERLQTVDNSTSNSGASLNNTATTPTPTSYSAWEALVKESFGQISWPIKITSWELVDDRVKIVPNR